MSTVYAAFSPVTPTIDHRAERLFFYSSGAYRFHSSALADYDHRNCWRFAGGDIKPHSADLRDALSPTMILVEYFDTRLSILIDAHFLSALEQTITVASAGQHCLLQILRCIAIPQSWHPSFKFYLEHDHLE